MDFLMVEGFSFFHSAVFFLPSWDMGKYVESIHLFRISPFFVSFSESFVALAEK